MTVNQNSIALSSDRGSLEIAGASLLYEGTRVKSYLLGRDLNPMGRGDGSLYAHGMFSAGNMRPIASVTPVVGFGNSVNNGSAYKFFEKDPGCWMEPGECGWVMGGWKCNVFKCFYEPASYGGGGQVPGNWCTGMVTDIVCQLSLLKSREYIKTGKMCFDPDAMTCVESAELNLYSQSALVTTATDLETCKEYSIDHIMYLFNHMGAGGPCVERDPCSQPIVKPMEPAGAGSGCPGCGAAGGGGSGAGLRYKPGDILLGRASMYGPGGVMKESEGIYYLEMCGVKFSMCSYEQMSTIRKAIQDAEFCLNQYGADDSDTNCVLDRLRKSIYVCSDIDNDAFGSTPTLDPRRITLYADYFSTTDCWRMNTMMHENLHACGKRGWLWAWEPYVTKWADSYMLCCCGKDQILVTVHGGGH